MDENQLKQGLTAAREWLAERGSPRGNTYKFLQTLLDLASANPTLPVRRADVLLAMGRDANVPPGDFVRTDHLLRVWDIVVRHCGSALRPDGGARVQLKAETVSRVLLFSFVIETHGNSSADEGSAFVLEGGCLRYSEEVSTRSLGVYGKVRYPRPLTDITNIWPRLYFVLPTLAYIVAFVIISMMATLQFTFLVVRPSVTGLVTGLLVLGIAALIYFARIVPALRDKAHRVSVMPERFIKLDEVPPVLEFIRDGEKRYLRVVNFQSSCVLCDGDVHLSNGTYEFKGRIVGRCVESPLEHVYSFDRMTLEGTPLRAKRASAFATQRA